MYVRNEFKKACVGFELVSSFKDLPHQWIARHLASHSYYEVRVVGPKFSVADRGKAFDSFERLVKRVAPMTCPNISLQCGVLRKNECAWFASKFYEKNSEISLHRAVRDLVQMEVHMGHYGASLGIVSSQQLAYTDMGLQVRFPMVGSEVYRKEEKDLESCQSQSPNLSDRERSFLSMASTICFLAGVDPIYPYKGADSISSEFVRGLVWDLIDNAAAGPTLARVYRNARRRIPNCSLDPCFPCQGVQPWFVDGIT